MTSKKKRSKSKSPSDPAASSELKHCDLCGAPSAALAYSGGNAVCAKCATSAARSSASARPQKQRARPADEATPNAPEQVAPKPAASKRKGRTTEAAVADASPAGAIPADDVVTLAALCERYIAALDAGGEHSMGTMRGYTAELKVACREIGGETALVDLTVERVQRFFDCDAVTKTRAGEGKSPVGVAKTRRVLRLALVWAHEQGLVAQVPVPVASNA